jgi:hypothetical protein
VYGEFETFTRRDEVLDNPEDFFKTDLPAFGIDKVREMQPFLLAYVRPGIQKGASDQLLCRGTFSSRERDTSMGPRFHYQWTQDAISTLCSDTEQVMPVLVAGGLFDNSC